MSIFRFRYFSVENEESAMKVNTDGVLLGALMTVRPEDRTWLDVGTGTGTVALMAAQRISAMAEKGGTGHAGGIPASVLAIDIDAPSAREAARNFAASPWPSMLESVHSSLDGFRAAGASMKFDRIFSNPPYYDLSLEAPDSRRNTARHTESLSYRELTDFSSVFLSENGLLSIILPAVSETWLLRHARMSGLYLFRLVRIRTTHRKQPSRIVAEFSRHRSSDPSVSLLTIRDGQSYTPEYIALTRDFYLWQK